MSLSARRAVIGEVRALVGILRARLGAPVEPPDLDDAAKRLDAALATLEELGAFDEDDGEARARAEQERGPDGRFASGGGGPKAKAHDDQGRAVVGSAGTKDGLGRSKAAGQARKDSASAKAATAAAKKGGSHIDAAKAHQDAAAQHREAAAKSVRADYKAAHEMAAKAHEDVAKAHAAEHAKATAPKKNGFGQPVRKPSPAQTKRDQAHAPFVSKAPKPADHEAAVRAALDKATAAHLPGDLIPVREVRAAAGLPKADFDKAALSLSKKGEAVLHHHDFPSSLRPEEREQLVHDPTPTADPIFGKGGTHYIGIAKPRRP